MVGLLGAVDQRAGENRLGIFLLGVMQETGRGQGRVRRQRSLRVTERSQGLVARRGGDVGLTAVQGADGLAAGAYDPARRGKADFARGIDRVEFLADAVGVDGRD